MAWFKVDDGFYSSLKFLSIDRAVQVQAAGAWVLAGTWSADKMTDGLVPYKVMDLWVFDAEVVSELVRVGLWDHDEDNEGIRFHDWHDYQPSREQLEEKAKARHDKSVKAANARWTKNDAQGMLADAQGMLNNAPEPEPEPEPTTSKDVVRRATRIPEPFNVTEDMVEWAKREVPAVDIGRETQKFADHFKANGKPLKDWEAAWRNWMRRSREFQGDVSQDSIEAARADRERRRVEHDRMVAEREAARLAATAPPDCPHGSTIVSCLTCARELAGVAS